MIPCEVRSCFGVSLSSPADLLAQQFECNQNGFLHKTAQQVKLGEWKCFTLQKDAIQVLLLFPTLTTTISTHAQLTFDQIDSKSKNCHSKSCKLKCIFGLEGPFDVYIWHIKVHTISCEMRWCFGVSLSSPADLLAQQFECNQNGFSHKTAQQVKLSEWKCFTLQKDAIQVPLLFPTLTTTISTYAHLIFDQIDSKSKIIPSNSHVLKCIF